EDGEPPERIAATCEGRRPHALRVPLEPCVDELGEGLRLRRVERAEGDAAIDLVTDGLGVALPGPDRAPTVTALGKRLLHRPVLSASDDARLLPHPDLLRSRTAASARVVRRWCGQPSSDADDSPAVVARLRTDALHVDHGVGWRPRRSPCRRFEAEPG